MNYKIADVCLSYAPRSKRFAQKLQPFACTEAPVQVRFGPVSTEKRKEEAQLLLQLSKLLLRQYDGMLLHAVAVCLHNKAYLLVAPSGVGKTTHARLWLEHIPGTYILNGDKPFLRCTGGEIRVYGSPWQGKEDLGINASAPLAGIFLLERAPGNRAETLLPYRALASLMNATVVPKNAEDTGKVLALMEKVLGNVPVCRLQCNMEPDAALTALAWAEREG